jgi:TolB-like protein
LRKALGGNSEDSRLIVTISRKGYQFTADVALAETPDVTKRDAAQVPASGVSMPGIAVEAKAGNQNSPAEATDVLESPKVNTAIPKPGSRWRLAAVLSAFAVVLVVAGYSSWRRFRAPPPRSEKIMLAVLPFQNLTGDPNKEYLADGLTEEMISQSGRLNPEQLGVIARTSVMGYKHKDVRLDQIGRDLSVQYVVENSLRESGNHIRLTAQLIQVKDQTHLWSQEYDYPVKDFLTVEDDVAKAVAREIRVRLTSKQQAELAQSHPVNPEAFDACSPSDRPFLYAIAYYALGRKKESDAALSELITKYHAGYAYQIAEVYAFRNQPDEAFEWLDRAYAQRDGGLVGTKVEPLLKSLHNDPRYAAFLKKMRLPL